ncbi:MAG TPA: UbiA family prenyltransferase, partial [Candidatus Norongarragalinales archaeon]|nr:UbiA family prenyltransferase [Candidatus Norongarragalinales archaeon]
MSVSFLYGNLAVSNVLQPNVLLYAAVAFFAGLGRELVITLRDVEGDKKIGARTLPMILGPKKTVMMTSVLITIGVFFSLIPLLHPVHPAYLVAVIITDGLFLAGSYYALLSQKRETLQKARHLTLYGMLKGVAAFAALGL